MPARRVAELAGMLRSGARLLAGARMGDAQALPALAADAEAALRQARTGSGVPAGWRLGARLTTVADVAVLEIRDGDALAAVLKLARSAEGDRVLARELATVATLASDARLDGWHRRLPEVLAAGTAGGRGYAVHRAMPGTVGTALPATDDGDRAAVRAAAELHRATGRVTTATEDLVESWLQPGLALLAGTPTLTGPGRRRALTERLRERLHAGLTGRALLVGRTHGDYVPGNVFHDPAAEVSGVIDWGQSRDTDAALIDPLTYLLVRRCRLQRRQLGAVVRDLVRGAPLSPGEQALVGLHRAGCPGDPVAPDVAALLAWLRHVENNLLKSPRYGVNPAWVVRNVEPVLRAVGG